MLLRCHMTVFADQVLVGDELADFNSYEVVDVDARGAPAVGIELQIAAKSPDEEVIVSLSLKDKSRRLEVYRNRPVADLAVDLAKDEISMGRRNPIRFSSNDEIANLITNHGDCYESLSPAQKTEIARIARNI